MGDWKVLGNIVRGIVVARHGRRRGPSEVVVKCLPEGPVLGQSDVDQGLVEAGNRAEVHLLVWSVAAVHPHDRGFVAQGVGVGGGPAESLGPVGGESLAVLWVETMAERVANDLVGHDPVVPRAGQANETLLAPCRLVDRLHGSTVAYPRRQRPGSPSRTRIASLGARIGTAVVVVGAGGPVPQGCDLRVGLLDTLRLSCFCFVPARGRRWNGRRRTGRQARRCCARRPRRGWPGGPLGGG